MVDPQSLFDIQVKRLHEYKRQHLNVLYLVTAYNRIDRGAGAAGPPRTMIFGGKAAPGYRMAKLIIRLIHGVADVVNRDPRVSPLLKVVFLPDFNVKNAQHVYPGRGSVGADLDRRQGGLGNRQHEVRDERGPDDRHAGRRQRRDPRGGGRGQLLPVRADRARGSGGHAPQRIRPRAALREPTRAARGHRPHRRRSVLERRPRARSGRSWSRCSSATNTCSSPTIRPTSIARQRVERGVPRSGELDADVHPELARASGVSRPIARSASTAATSGTSSRSRSADGADD